MLDRYSTITDPGAYLRRVIVHAVYQRSRASGRERKRLELVARASAATTPGPSGGVSDAIAALPLNQRTVVILRYWADLDHRAIADAMDLRTSTVRVLLTRALTQLRRTVTP